MEIIIGKTAGFCGGIQNAVKKAEEVLKINKKVYCLGELTHNATVMEKLKKDGLCVVQDIGEIPENENVIIRAHGVSPEIYEQANRKNLKIIDLTCKNVLKIHNQVEEYVKDGYYIILTGKKNHPETIGICGYGKDRLVVIENLEEIENVIDNITKKRNKKNVIISQTTFSLEMFEKIVNALKQKIDNLEVKNTICNATQIRQAEAKEISESVDAMIIIGGKNSSNSKKLYDIANDKCKNTYFIETKKELDTKKIIKFEKIGIMAGASTPQESIKEVINLLKNNI